MILRFTLLLFFVLQQSLSAQEANLSVTLIPAELRENADAVVRLDRLDITISSVKSMSEKKTRIVTVLNESGLKSVNAVEYFDKSTSIQSIEAVVYDQGGNQIKKFKRKDFKEVAVSEGSIITDNRMLYLDYTAVQYPFTIVFTSETETSTTAFLPMWSAVEGSYTSTQKSEVNITCNPSLKLKYKEYNFDGAAVTKQQNGNVLSYSAVNITAMKREDYSPSYQKIFPFVMFGLDKFYLEGVEGHADSWESFGTWVYNSLLAGTDELPEETITKIKTVVGTETDPLKKAKKVYEYVQSKTRYISIQLGIGGWKPMKAKDVDRLGYGDCKALTNYTRVLLKAVGVESYYTIIYGDSSKRDIKEDFVSMQGNHVILAIPNEGKIVWLECTSQVLPFGFQGDFTDDRMALLVKPEKSELVRTTIYDAKNNLQACKGNYSISPTGSISASFVMASRGTQYDNKYFLEAKSKSDRDTYYKSGFPNVNNLKIKKADLKNNKDTQEFTEDIVVEADGYCTKTGDKLIFAVNAFNQYSNIPQRYRSRKNPFEISRGFLDTDEMTITIPEGFVMEAKPENVTIKDKFGEYSVEYITSSTGSLQYKRLLLINPGYYASTDYEAYRLFREKIARTDNAKVVLVKK